MPLILPPAETSNMKDSFTITLKVKGRKNCLFMHTGKESLKHWLTKAVLFKLIRDRGRTAGTEIELNGGIIDVVDIDNLIGYEVESKPNVSTAKRKLKRLWQLRDVFFIDAGKVPDDIGEAEKYLERFVV